MSKRNKLRAKVRRRELLSVLGGCCVKCGTTRKLEFDCIIPQGDKHHRMDTSARMSFYWQQHLNYSNIQILCKKHNTQKSLKERGGKLHLSFLNTLPGAGGFQGKKPNGGLLKCAGQRQATVDCPF